MLLFSYVEKTTATNIQYEQYMNKGGDDAYWCIHYKWIP